VCCEPLSRSPWPDSTAKRPSFSETNCRFATVGDADSSVPSAALLQIHGSSAVCAEGTTERRPTSDLHPEPEEWSVHDAVVRLGADLPHFVAGQPAEHLDLAELVRDRIRGDQDQAAAAVLRADPDPVRLHPDPAHLGVRGDIGQLHSTADVGEFQLNDINGNDSPGKLKVQCNVCPSAWCPVPAQSWLERSPICDGAISPRFRASG
jgi:hypothetical protein